MSYLLLIAEHILRGLEKGVIVDKDSVFDGIEWRIERLPGDSTLQKRGLYIVAITNDTETIYGKYDDVFLIQLEGGAITGMAQLKDCDPPRKISVQEVELNDDKLRLALQATAYHDFSDLPINPYTITVEVILLRNGLPSFKVTKKDDPFPPVPMP